MLVEIYLMSYLSNELSKIIKADIAVEHRKL